MELKRKPIQGVYNILRFNWHLYLVAILLSFSLMYFKQTLPEQIQVLALGLSILSILTICISLLISLYVYDISSLYKLNWIPNLDNKKALNINAGFDETSKIIQCKFPNVILSIADFYNPNRHTEVSIKRARHAYPPIASTIQVSTAKFPFHDSSFDYTLAIFSAHEIRSLDERIQFFKELNRVTKPKGYIYVTEHLRDLNNFLAYTIGFFHFFSKPTWLSAFKQANLTVRGEIRTTIFVTTFILEKNGDSF